MLAQRAYWCRKYARVNAIALRKILKKHDKLCNNRRGHAFLQVHLLVWWYGAVVWVDGMISCRPPLLSPFLAQLHFCLSSSLHTHRSAGHQ